MFMHGGFLHLGGNMLYLWIFGNNVEDAMGACALSVFLSRLRAWAAALTEGFAEPDLAAAMLGCFRRDLGRFWRPMS